MNNFETIANDFITEFQSKKNSSPKTVLAYESDLRDFVAFLKDNKLDEQIVPTYMNHLTVTKKLGDSTIRRKLIVLNHFFKYMTAHGHIERNYCEKAPFKIKQTKWHPEVLTTQEVDDLLICARSKIETAVSTYQLWLATRNLALIDLLASTGIRIEEAANIAITDVFDDLRLLVIHGRDGKSRDTYISCDDTWNNLSDWMKLRRTCPIVSDKLFVNRYGAPISIHGIEHIYCKLRDAAGINPNSTPHYLRHTFAYNLLANGADLQTVQELMGHMSVAITEAYVQSKTTQKKTTLDNLNYRNKLSVSKEVKV